MRFPQVKLTVVEPRGVRQCTYDEPASLLVGRSSSCQLPLSRLGPASQLSRRHCLIEIDPPFITVSDLASTNGTYVNGERIPLQVNPADTPRDARFTCPLKDGDEVLVGEVLLRVHIVHEEEPTVSDPTSEFECDEEPRDSAEVLNALSALEQRCRAVQ